MPGNDEFLSVSGAAGVASGTGGSVPVSRAEAGARALSLYYRARCLEEESGSGEALEAYLEVLALSGPGPELNARLVRLYASLNRLDEALALEERTVAAFPDDAGALLALSGFLDQHRNHAPDWKTRALETAREAAAKFPDSAAAVRHLVRLCLAEQDRAGAQKAVRDAMRLSPSADPAFWMSLSTSARDAFPLDDAETLAEHFAIVSRPVERALDLAKDDPGILAAAADFYARGRRADRALPLYERAAALSPGDLTTRRKLGQCLRMAGRDAEAIPLFESLTAIDAGDVVSHKALVSLYENTDAARALKHRAEVLRLEGGDPRDYTAAASELLKTGLTGEALTLVKRGIFFNPQSAALLYLLARAQDTAGDFPAALESLGAAETMALSRSPRLLDTAFYYSWAGVARRAGKTEEAERRYRQAIEKAPAARPELAAPSYNDLGWLWLTENRNLEAAGELLRTANGLVPDHAPYLDSLGWFHFLKKDYPAALNCLRRAVELSGPDGAGPELREHLAAAEAAAGKDAKDQKDTKDQKDAKDAKDAKDQKDQKGAEDPKSVKE